MRIEREMSKTGLMQGSVVSQMNRINNGVNGDRTIMSMKELYNMSKKSIKEDELEREPEAVGRESDYKDHTDPKYVGPGTWNVIHRNAFRSQNHKQQEEFISFMKEVCEGFPCDVCRGHCKEYIKNHPMEEYIDTMVEIDGEKMGLGMFVWSWKFHNAVNKRIKKPIMSWNTAYNLYSEKESLICSKNCMNADNGGEEEEKESKETNNKDIEYKIPNYTVINKPFRFVSNRQ